MASFSRLTTAGTASPALRSALRARFAELGGLVLLALAFVICVALWSYNPLDPSFNTSSETPPSNLLGQVGASLSDFLVQWLGLASAVPVVVLVAWAWQIVRTHTLSAPFLRIVAFGGLLPACAATFSAIQVLVPSFATTWPSRAGFGGQIGLSLAQRAVAAGHAALGKGGSVIGPLLVLFLTLLLIPLAMGLSRREWRFLGRIAAILLRQPHRLVARARGKPAAEPDWRAYEAQVAPIVDRPSAARNRPFTPPNTGWLQPPGQDEEQAYTPPALRPAEPAPANPYADQLARIARDRAPEHDAPHQSSVGSTALTVPDAAENPAPAEPVGMFKRGLFGIFRGESTAEKTSEPRSTSSGHARRPGWDASPWTFPALGLLKQPPAAAYTGPSNEVLQANARLLEQVLGDYSVQGQIGDIHAGPVVTLYEFEPAPGIRSARVIGLADDIARSLSVLSVRIATVPGRNVIGIEVPNARRETVYFSDLLAAPLWTQTPGALPLALGKDIAGAPIYADLARMPHLLIAGTTGSGKSVGVNAMILSLLFRLSPEECRLIMIDPKILELSIYDGIPHLLTPVVTEPNKAVAALKWTVREMDRRYRVMAHLQVRNIAGYNDRVREARGAGELLTRRVQTGFDPETGRPVFEEQQINLESMPFIVVVIDEMADLMMVAGKEIEAAVQRLAQKARAAGIHVIMATQRPSVDVITGTIKANFPTRISFQVISKFDSRTILGEQGAEQLLGQGDMLFMQGGGRITRVHGPFVADAEVEDVVRDLRSKGEPVYNDDVVSGMEEEDDGSRGSASGNGMNGGYDAETSLFDQAVDLVTREGKASTSFIQRHLSIGYNRAAKIIEEMEKQGIVSAANHVGKREVLTRRAAED
ncbi:DNA translocase FtsK [Acidomonas methanolica]|uniref:DNA translocase FtsK n=2 Tax=Acidomonas methanolica TaxID=437 RepID=A0A023D3A8_ACIMT|nr:DNA translocase FtsK [Acidomonas methanolica]MBU2653541.1 DNA translocase FtsK [Acidomonas methanolica]TCS31491.1 S-DNA-T family DNA segregation ATPase FtsK/SpoIIIE [Acidomonas methanolica]GAJ28286.1 cell division DNA translocase FtsK [Acidomonas methanolica NBRC 104435]GEK97911.1 DNA translocase FtsK [Acidomonas methanolica NBRC 104435]